MPRKTNENKELELKAKKGEAKANSAVRKAEKNTVKSTTSNNTKKVTSNTNKVKKVAKSAPQNTKTTSKNSTKTAKNNEKPQAKKVASTKKTATSKTTKNVENKVAKNNSKTVKKSSEEDVKNKEQLKENIKEKDTKKIDKKDNKDNKKEEIKQETVIQKIKNFIAKIMAMQEEARKEEAEKALAKKNAIESEISKEKEAKNKKSISKIDTSYMLEYYDLPYRYNETVVKILAQTPKRLFVYWDISDGDREKLLKAFGEKFFEETYPVLLVHNEEKKYTFEVPINDFANSWYLDINDPKSNYVIQLGRKFRRKPEKVNILASSGTADVVLQNDYVPIITSNILEVPNDHILFENIQTRALYRNVKNGNETYIELNNKDFAKRMGHIYSIYDIYKEIYKNEIDNESLFDLLNPSSMSSSAFK